MQVHVLKGSRFGHPLQHTLYQPGANLNLAENVNECFDKLIKTFNMFIASYLNMSTLIEQIFVGNSVAILSTEVCCLYSNTRAHVKADECMWPYYVQDQQLISCFPIL